MTKENKSSVARHWTFIVYPESAPKDWREKLDAMMIPWIESPLHCDDVNPDGTTKKAHYHVYIYFAGKKNFNAIKEITDSLNSPIPQVVNSATGCIRYFAHLDNPEKAQYPISSIIAHGGADLADLLKPTNTDRYKLIAEMIEYIITHGVIEFVSFIDYCRAEKFDDWFPLMCDSASFIIDKVIKSNRHKAVKTLVELENYGSAEAKKIDINP